MKLKVVGFAVVLPFCFLPAVRGFYFAQCTDYGCKMVDSLQRVGYSSECWTYSEPTARRVQNLTGDSSGASTPDGYLLLKVDSAGCAICSNGGDPTWSIEGSGGGGTWRNERKFKCVSGNLGTEPGDDPPSDPE